LTQWTLAILAEPLVYALDVELVEATEPPEHAIVISLAVFLQKLALHIIE